MKLRTNTVNTFFGVLLIFFLYLCHISYLCMNWGLLQVKHPPLYFTMFIVYSDKLQSLKKIKNKWNHHQRKA